MAEEKFVDAEDKLAIWETPMLTTLEASDAEVAPVVGPDAGVLAS